MAMANRFIVIAALDRDEPPYHECQIIKADDVYPQIYKQVFGPANRKRCEDFVKENCEGSGATM